MESCGGDKPVRLKRSRYSESLSLCFVGSEGVEVLKKSLTEHPECKKSLHVSQISALLDLWYVRYNDHSVNGIWIKYR